MRTTNFPLLLDLRFINFWFEFVFIWKWVHYKQTAKLFFYFHCLFICSQRARNFFRLLVGCFCWYSLRPLLPRHCCWYVFTLSFGVCAFCAFCVCACLCVRVCVHYNFRGFSYTAIKWYKYRKKQQQQPLGLFTKILCVQKSQRRLLFSWKLYRMWISQAICYVYCTQLCTLWQIPSNWTETKTKIERYCRKNLLTRTT